LSILHLTLASAFCPPSLLFFSIAPNNVFIRYIACQIAVNERATDFDVVVLMLPLLAGADSILLNRFMPGGRGLRHRDLELNKEQLTEMLDTAEVGFCSRTSVLETVYGEIVFTAELFGLRTFVPLRRRLPRGGTHRRRRTGVARSAVDG